MDNISIVGGETGSVRFDETRHISVVWYYSKGYNSMVVIMANLSSTYPFEVTW